MNDIIFQDANRQAASPATARLGTARLAEASRTAWVDYAKGWSIILVVTMHSALGVGLAVGENGWLHELVAFAKPFRMPDFFVVAGLFLGRVIDKPWRGFLDRRVIHFVYFYALWLFIALLAKSAELDLRAPDAFLRAYLQGFIEPFSSMWFIQLLPILFVATRLMNRWPTALVLAGAAGMHLLAASFPEGGAYAMSSQMTGWTTIDSFSLFFVYFLTGYLFSGRVFGFARWVAQRSWLAMAGLVLWAILEQASVKLGLAEVPGATLVFGLAGAAAVIALSVLLAKTGTLGWLAYCGRNSLVIYLAFFVPMAATRILLLKTGLVTDVGLMSLIVAAAAVISPLALNAAVRGTVLGFLFARPSWARWQGSSAALRIAYVE